MSITKFIFPFTFLFAVLLPYTLCSFLNFPTSGLTDSSCTHSKQCRGDRSCLDASSGEDCAAPHTGCRCAPKEFIKCDANSQCPQGEICSRFSVSPFTCISGSFKDVKNSFNVDDAKDPDVAKTQLLDCPTDDVNVEQTPGFSSNVGLNYDPCLANINCKENRQCWDFVGNACCDGGTLTCMCVPPKFDFCENNENCDAEEECLRTKIDPPRCVSKKAKEAFETSVFSEGSGAVCVDAEALAHLPAEDKVFEKDQVARVLCDGWTTCATPGHMVVWKGQAMMMETYCAVLGAAGCHARVIKVNSPKWKVGLRVGTKTEGLQFTAFAARWASTVEESVLRTAVHVGL